LFLVKKKKKKKIKLDFSFMFLLKKKDATFIEKRGPSIVVVFVGVLFMAWARMPPCRHAKLVQVI
jgi:hypothetical protein